MCVAVPRGRDATHGQVVVRDAAAGGLAADAQDDRPAWGAVVVEELEVALLEPPVVLRAVSVGTSDGAQVKNHSSPSRYTLRARAIPGMLRRSHDWMVELTYSGGEVVEALLHPPLVRGQVPAASGGRPGLGDAREE